MTGRIVEMGLAKAVEEGPCEWYDPKRSFEKSLCDPQCNGYKGCRYYTSRTHRPNSSSANGDGLNSRTHSDSFPD